MRVHKVVVLFAFALLLVWGTGADNKGMKIGVVDIDQAVGNRMHVFAVRKGRRQVNMVIIAGVGDDKGSRIVVNEVMNDLL